MPQLEHGLAVRALLMWRENFGGTWRLLVGFQQLIRCSGLGSASPSRRAKLPDDVAQRRVGRLGDPCHAPRESLASPVELTQRFKHLPPVPPMAHGRYFPVFRYCRTASAECPTALTAARN